MKSIPLEEMLAFLRGQSHEDFRRGVVDEFLETHAVNSASLAPFTYFREDTYARNLIARTERFELLVIAWLPRHRTPIHDHGGQRCWMWVDTGELTFSNYENAPANRREGQFHLVRQGPCQTLAAGSQVYIDDGIGIHAIANASKKPAISLHLYAGPVSQCRIYDEQTKRFEWKTLEYHTVPGRTSIEVATFTSDLH
jgi:cysteine dioxygenase